MDCDAAAYTWMHSPRPALTLTFDLHNVIRSSVGASEYFLSVSSILLKPLMGYRGKRSVRTNEKNKRMNAADEDSPETFIHSFYSATKGQKASYKSRQTTILYSAYVHTCHTRYRNTGAKNSI